MSTPPQNRLHKQLSIAAVMAASLCVPAISYADSCVSQGPQFPFISGLGNPYRPGDDRTTTFSMAGLPGDKVIVTPQAPEEAAGSSTVDFLKASDRSALASLIVTDFSSHVLTPADVPGYLLRIVNNTDVNETYLIACAPAADAHDFNLNSKSDILLRANTGNIAMWFMDGTTLQSGADLGAIDPAWQIIRIPTGSGDFNGDGKADILWHHSNGSVALWLMNGATISSAASIGTVDTSWQIAAAGDFDGDGKVDILWQNASGALAIWFMDGTTIASTAAVTGLPPNWQVAGLADLDGDGKADIVLRNTTTGDVAVWLMNGATVASAAGLGVLPTAWQIVGTGDFNGDGKGDILWRHSTGALAMWFMNGTTIASGASLGTVATAWNVASTGDYDGNSKADILWRNTSGDVAMWLMNGATVASAAGLGVLPLAWSIVE